MCMSGLDALGIVIVGGIGACAGVGTLGALGLSKQIINYVQDDKNKSRDNKIQSVVATVFSLLAGIALSIVSPAFLYIGIGLSLAINTPHIAKLFVKDPKTKEKLDNIAGVAAASLNTLALLPIILGLVL